MHQDMKDRHRWKADEDALLHAYVRQFGPREWHLVSQRMNTALGRDAKSCLERWKNYLKPGIKKGSLTEEEQQLVIRLQAKHGNKWKKIAAEVPGRTAKRLGKWWEVFKEKQQRDKESNKAKEPLEEGKYDQILETFAEKLVKERPAPALMFMATSNGSFMCTDPPPAPPPNLFPPWLSAAAATTNGTTPVRQPHSSPSVSLSLSPSTVAPPPIPWLQREREPNNTFPLGSLHPHAMIPGGAENMLIFELAECCRELEEGHRAWTAHKKEAEWRLRRVELQLESEKACRKREKVQEIESKMKALREEERVTLDRIEVEYRDQLVELKRDAEAKEQAFVERWAAKHSRLNTFLEQMVCRPRPSEPNGR